MILSTFLVLASMQQPQMPQAPAAGLKESPVSRIVVTPAEPVVHAGDTLRLQAQALDAGGNPVEGARIRFLPAGGRFEGRVDSTGLVTAGSTGTLPVSLIATVPGARPSVSRVEVQMVPGPAARIDLTPGVTRLVPGQRIHLDAAIYSAAGDPRADT
ncbi:MAG: hypothetical protein ACREL6_06620, partial [Gemmatimonadales bacterium]